MAMSPHSFGETCIVSMKKCGTKGHKEWDISMKEGYFGNFSCDSK